MPTDFENWYDWATGQHDSSPRKDAAHWRVAARNAKGPAPYAGTETRSSFQQAIGSSDPRERSAYEAVCSDYQLSGATVDGDVPPFLTRCMKESVLEHYVGLSVLDGPVSGDLPTLGIDDEQRVGVSMQEIPSDHWVPLRALPAVDGAPRFSPGPPGDPVFATFAPGDDTDPHDDHTPGFWSLVQDHAHADWSAADVATYRLASVLQRKKKRPDTYVLIYYHAAAYLNDHEFLYPTPPDGGLWPFFRAVRPGSHPYGRTWPEGGVPCKVNHGVDEVVHPPLNVDHDDVWVIALGSMTSTRR